MTSDSRRFRVLPLICLALGVVALGANADDGSVPDPVHVYYADATCASGELELEIWDREARAWVAHPRHRRVPTQTCQIEDAGVLLNELRWRCADSAVNATAPDAGWVIGLDVFDAEVMSHCAVDQIAANDRETSISISSPREGVAVQAPTPRVAVEGSVRVAGLEGVDYDVVLAIDRSAPAAGGVDSLHAQVEAARAWLRAVTPRLGAVRVGIVSYPNLPPGPGESTAARREVALTDDVKALHAVMERLRWRRSAGLSTTPAALTLAIDELTGAAARPRARRVLVLMADGGLDGALGSGSVASERPGGDDPHLALAERAAERGIRLHLFALGGLSEQPPPRVREMLDLVPGSFTRVLPRELPTPFLAPIGLPIAETVSIETEGGRAPRISVPVDARGRFRAEVTVEPGENRFWVSARTSDGATARRVFRLVFDDALILERILEAERERIRRAQRKHLELDGDRPPAP